MRSGTILTVTLLACSQLALGITLDITSQESIKAAASAIAYDMAAYYTGNHTGDVPGTLPSPYYWWETGAMFGTLVDYWYYTGDTTYNNITSQALLFQRGPYDDYMPPNQTKDEGNDDQGFWGMSAMAAAELQFPDPPSRDPGWLALAQAVFNTQAARWDVSTCAGGLRWQIFPFNSGYTYKNSISNGVFFNIGSRLALYTNNATYAEWVEKTWDWVVAIGLIDISSYTIYDGTDDTQNCTSLNHLLWTYNAGIYLHGAAAMYNYTNGSALWKERVEGLMHGTATFFPTDDIMEEISCESANSCNADRYSFKAYLARWMAASTKLAPFLYDDVMVKLKASAVAAALQCSGGKSGRVCGIKWTDGAKYDGSSGVGQQMSALEVIQSLLISSSGDPVTGTTGGTSTGNSNAGSNSRAGDLNTSPVGIGSRVAAAFVTVVLLAAVVSGTWWLLTGHGDLGINHKYSELHDG